MYSDTALFHPNLVAHQHSAICPNFQQPGIESVSPLSLPIDLTMPNVQVKA